MRYFPLGRAATEGDGPIRYSLRVPVWPGDNVRLDGLEKFEMGDVHPTRIGGKDALIEKRDHFMIVKVLGFTAIETAEAMWSRLAISMVRSTAFSGAALQFPFSLTAISRGDDPNIRFREQIPESEYPTRWIRRANGSMTDGGIFGVDACILPEHERIWEYPISFGKILRIFDPSQLDRYLSESTNFPADAIADETIRIAVQALWLACTATDRRIQFVLLVTALDVLSSDERVPSWAAEIQDIISEIQSVIQSRSRRISEGIQQKLSRKIGEIGNPGMADKIRNLIPRAFGLNKSDSPESGKLIQEVNNILKKRAGLAHGGKILCAPTADENERLREIVSKALDQRMRECGVSNR